jgi:archaellum biogenesis ATPase FlaH
MRSLTTKNLFDMKVKKIIKIDNDILQTAIGNAEAKGVWVIYGFEKNGKTTFVLILAKALCKSQKVAYISAEEGTDLSFTEAVKRAGLTTADKIAWYTYLSLEDIVKKFSKPKSADVIVIDNATMYADEFKNLNIKELENKLPNKLIILLCHEERKEAHPAAAKLAKKMAKVIFQIKGLTAFCVSRFSGKSTQIKINDTKATLYWGDEIQQQ